MPKSIERILLLLSDFTMVVLAFLLLSMIRREIGIFSSADFKEIFYLGSVSFLFWLVTFIFFGLYRSWYAQSRIDEFVSIFKTITIGCGIIFLLTMEPHRDFEEVPSIGRLSVVTYWVLLLIMVTIGRLILRTFQRKLLENGIGVRKTLIIGWNEKARHLYDEILKFPALGYKVIGFIDDEGNATNQSHRDMPVLGNIRQISQLVQRYRVEEIIIALKAKSQKKVLYAINQCDGLPVNLKIVPTLYHIIIGQARTSQIYGFPLIEILPEMMPAWEKKVKRFIDVMVSLIVIVCFLPVWIFLSLLIKLTSAGPVFYKQKRVGKDGKIFTVYKFRSMYQDAEKRTGPVWAGKKDPRITPIGGILRKLRLDEIPQFINVLDGDMSLVGPRPERPYFVDHLKRQVPLYARRLKIKPGITGWAQIKGDYDTSLESVKKKLEYDLFYMESMSLRMDLKIIFNTILIMLRGKGQ
ncbi:undecaprenyl-phosphate glucose phosphotransferase [candidate division KSB1 bacterium]|nr:undecaprenyl-phosphate glucose phosphotransferase [candidate division KSB1 bacterium]